MGTQLYIRVNGVNISHIKIRPRMVDGALVGEREIVIDVPALGSLPALGMFAIDDSFVIEVKDTSIPAAERRLMDSKGWKIVSVQDLLAMLDSIGAIS